MFLISPASSADALQLGSSQYRTNCASIASRHFPMKGHNELTCWQHQYNVITGNGAKTSDKNVGGTDTPTRPLQRHVPHILGGCVCDTRGPACGVTGGIKGGAVYEGNMILRKLFLRAYLESGWEEILVE